MSRKQSFTRVGFGTEKIENLVLGGHEIPVDLKFVFGLSATQYGTVCEISVCNKDGNLIAGVHALDVYLSDAADGAGVTATDPNGTVAALANGGTVLGILTAKKAFRVTTLATGKFSLEIKDDVTPVLLYVAASIPSCGLVKVSRKTVAGDYKP